MALKALTRRSALFTTVFLSILASAVLDVAVFSPALVPSIIAAESNAGSLRVLSGADKEKYRSALALQKSGRYGDADVALSQVQNPLLKATIIAERFTARGYTPSYSEMTTWLAANADLPAAASIYRLALAQKPSKSAPPVEPASKPSLKGVVNGYGKSVLRDGKVWKIGMEAYKKKNMQVAARYFRSLADRGSENGLSANDHAAAAFWTYKAYSASGDKANAMRYLSKAAELPSAFYSILARNLSGQEHALTQNAGQDSEADIAVLLEHAPVKRAVALKEIGEDTLAEKELRSVYPAAGAITRAKLLTLAHRLDLPAIAMHMASGVAKETLSFPVPNWEPHSGYQVEKALLFAIMRQESGFNPNARSSAGAMGLMQLMPATARAMTRGNQQLGKSLDPSVNITLGQRYLEHLMDTDYIGDNLVYLMAAYNAGPGSLASWLRTARGNADPLLFIESIPYDQTRDYVVNVMANYWVYSELLDVGKPESLQALASGQWPRYDRPQNQLITLLSRVD